MTVPGSLDEIRDEAARATYPTYLFDKCDTALILFAAGFWGRQDGYWIQEAGLDATCVDLDGKKLREMEALYPSSWEFEVGEVFEYCATTDRMWDLVSIDPPTDQFVRCGELIEDFCALALEAVVLGVGPNTTWEPPPGWEHTDTRWRSTFRGGVYWAVLERTPA